MTLEEASEQIKAAYMAVLKHFSKEKKMSGVKLLCLANQYVLEKCVEVFEKFASQI